MRGIYWGLILLVLPAFIRLIPGGDLRFAKDGLFLWSALLGIGMFGVRAFKGGTLLVFCTISILTFFNQYHPYSASVYHQSLMVMGGWAVLAQAGLMDEWDWDNIEKFIVISVVIQVVWVISNSFGTDPWDWVGLTRNSIKGESMVGSKTIIGILHNPSISSALLAAMIPFCFGVVRKEVGDQSQIFIPWRFFIVMPVAFYALYLCNSTMAWAGIFVAFLWWICGQKGGWRWAAGISFLSLPILWVYRDSRFVSTSGRIPAWEAWWEYALNQGWWKNLVGNGVGFIHDRFRTIYHSAEQVFLQLHSEPLEIHAAWGVVGLACTAYLLTQIKDFRSKWWYAFLILWVNSFGNLTFHLSATTLLMILCYAKITQLPCKE